MALLVATMLTDGDVAKWSVVSIGLFNSIMFPTIFALGIERLGPLTGKASSLLVMAIVGGAIVPLAMGWVADHHGLQAAFVLQLLCYGFIVFYALRGRSAEHTSELQSRMRTSYAVSCLKKTQQLMHTRH